MRPRPVRDSGASSLPVRRVHARVRAPSAPCASIPLKSRHPASQAPLQARRVDSTLPIRRPTPSSSTPVYSELVCCSTASAGSMPPPSLPQVPTIASEAGPLHCYSSRCFENSSSQGPFDSLAGGPTIFSESKTQSK